MNFPDHLIDSLWSWVAFAAWLPLFFYAAIKAPWKRLLNQPEISNLWLGMIVLLSFVWQLRAGVKPGLSLHLLGVNLFALCFGWELALIGLSLVLFAATLNGDSGYLAFGVNAWLLVIFPLSFSVGFTRVIQKKLPANFFVFIFLNGFAGAALCVILVGFLSSVALALLEVYATGYLFEEYFPYFVLLAFSEAWITGMLVTLFAVYQPGWMVSFDDERYLKEK